MAKFCFVIHPVSFEDVVRYEPGAAGKGRPIVAKILEWMPSYAAAHLTGIRTPDGRETEGWFVAAPLLPEQMLALPREAIYERIVRAIEVGAALGAEIAGLGAFTGVVGDAGVTVAERAPIPVTTGNSLTIAAGVRSLFRGAAEMGIDAPAATAAVVGATGSIGAACVQLIAPHVRRIILVARNATVRMLLSAGQIALTAEGTALEDGAMGAHIRVQNPTSRAVVLAEITGADEVRIMTNHAPIQVAAQ